MFHRFEHSPLRVEFLEMLREIRGFHGHTRDELALGKFDLTLQHADQSCLARAVGSEYAEALTGADIPVEAFDEQLVTGL